MDTRLSLRRYARVVVSIFTLGVALALSTSQASAADFEVHGARPGFDVAKLEGLVRLELGDRAAASRISVVLAQGDRAEVSIDVEGDRRRGIVDVRGSRDPERTIALFIAELARTSSSTTSTVAPIGSADSPTVTIANEGNASGAPSSTASTASPVSSSSPEGASTADRTPTGAHDATSTSAPAPSTSARDTEDESAPRVVRPHALLAMEARWLVASRDAMWAPHLEGGILFRDALRLGIVARYAYASADDKLGDVSAHMITGGVAVTARLASTAQLGVWTGPRFEAGWLGGRGDGVRASSTSTTIVTAAWGLEGHAAFGALDTLATVEGGVLTQGLDLRADDRSVLVISGGFVGGGVGVALR